jgi:hypothetical protein
MRSPALFRPSRSLFVAHTIHSPSRPLRNAPAFLRSNAYLYNHFASSTSLPVPLDPNEPPADAPPSASEETLEKPKKRTRATKEADAPPQLPPGLNILWTPQLDDSDAYLAALPPPDILEEALTNLHITLHPKTQHRATYSSPTGLPLEPTLALYCPIEGGDYGPSLAHNSHCY